ncbi:hypothetical protein CCM_00584 [Cordyceps militaris CM01]|uniref:Uncharacterized protein n=1 Tax=Cordyceps militaris (strain CM01) TaxID=983644 RepID=G3J4W3_CORMM|nr:uncharacterized protein CCM_00584 [Cordyceps militaris CM01]EGX95930.1 hypothetical protein CCM_00584 [Cordyceps militaris CM01]
MKNSGYTSPKGTLIILLFIKLNILLLTIKNIEEITRNREFLYFLSYTIKSISLKNSFKRVSNYLYNK